MTFRDDPSPMYDEKNMERGLEYLKATDLRDSLRSFAARPYPPSETSSEGGAMRAADSCPLHYYRRSHAGISGSGEVPVESLDRKDGVRNRRGGGAART